MTELLRFFQNKRILITGHTGFKGTWLCMLLHMAGATVTGFALPPAGQPCLFDLAGMAGKINSCYGDIRDFTALQTVFAQTKPEIVFHLAAQSIVREGYRQPVETYHINVMGTVHLLECVRQSDCVRSVLNVTTDKVYQNRQQPRAYRETDRLDGSDPYASSKSCSELVTGCYQRSFLAERGIAVSTARAGNVIGGGDFAADRIIPDCIRAAQAGVPVPVRNPFSVRPYQHVLDALAAYLLIACRQYDNSHLMGSYNVGPDRCDCLSTGELVTLFCREWGGVSWRPTGENGPPEDAIIQLDCTRIRSVLGWQPRWKITRAIAETVAWTKAWTAGQHPADCMAQQCRTFLSSL